jgi:hypothetical protein
MGVGHASAQQAQAAKKFHHWSAQAPHISIKMIPSTAAHPINRFVISGIGFTTCCPSASTSYNTCSNTCSTSPTTSPCDSGCNTSPSTSPTTSSNPCDTATCSSTTSQTSSTDTNITTTTTTTSTTSPSTTTYTITPSTTAPASVPSNTSPATTPSDTCSSYDSCSSTAPSTTNTSPANTSPADTSSTNCACGNTVDLQSSAPLYAASGINLSRIPVNAFGEFNVTVNLHPRRFLTRHYNTLPTIWAINSYNEQPSNYASVACSCSSSCCQ